MAAKSAKETVLRITDLPQRHATAFVVEPAKAALSDMATSLGVSEIRKLRFEGTLRPEGTSDWRLEATLGATIVQPCIVTLAPVSTRIEETVSRRYVTGYEIDPEIDEMEMPDDDTIEPLRATVDLNAVLQEALSLAIPLYPRADDASLGEAIFTEPGSAPMTDDDARPFAGLADLKAKLEGKE